MIQFFVDSATLAIYKILFRWLIKCSIEFALCNWTMGSNANVLTDLITFRY